MDINGKDYICESQESKLAVLWTLGIFALNFGPVVVGFLLDWAGPKLTALTGKYGLMHFPDASSALKIWFQGINHVAWLAVVRM